jgi:hypothetical protein
MCDSFSSLLKMLLTFNSHNCRDQIDVIPKVIPQVYDDWFCGATDDNPLERFVVRRIDLLDAEAMQGRTRSHRLALPRQTRPGHPSERNNAIGAV